MKFTTITSSFHTYTHTHTSNPPFRPILRRLLCQPKATRTRYAVGFGRSLLPPQSRTRPVRLVSAFAGSRCPAAVILTNPNVSSYQRETKESLFFVGGTRRSALFKHAEDPFVLDLIARQWTVRLLVKKASLGHARRLKCRNVRTL